MKTEISQVKKEISTEEPKFNLKEFLFKYVHFSWLFILTLTVSMITAWLFLRYSKPLYVVNSSLLIRTEQQGGGGAGAENMFADIALFQTNTNKQNEIQILLSRTIMERVVKTLGLQTRYYAEGNLKTTSLYKNSPVELVILQMADSTKGFGIKVHLNDNKSFNINEGKEIYYFGQEIKLAGNTFKLMPGDDVNSVPQRNIAIMWQPVPNAAGSLSGGLAIKPANDMSTVLVLSYTTDIPNLGSDVINQLVIEYNKATIEDKNEINRKMLAFITDRLELVESQLLNVEVDLQKFKSNNQIIDLTAQSGMFFNNKSELDKSIIQQEIQLQVAELIENYISDPKNRYTLVPSTLGLTDPTLLELVSNYNKVATERLEEMQTGATANNPVIKNIEKVVEEARLKILTNLVNIKQAYRNAINSLRVQSGLLAKEISSIPLKELQGREKARQQEIKQNLYLYLLQKREESEIAQASVIANSRVIDEALPTYSRVSPIPARIYSIAALIGLLLPVVIIFILDLLRDKVTTRADIEKITNIPIMAEIGHSEGEKVLLFPRKTKGIIAEQFRILRSNMRFVLGDLEHSPSLLITSSFSGEGKSFVSTNIGASFALSGQKTVILEFDLRKPKIVSGLNLQKSLGLTNYLVGAVKLEELPIPVKEVDGLWVIPCGPVPPNPSELLMTNQINELFAWLRNNFDMIVIDTAPVGLVSDALNLSQYADATLYVIRQRYTYKRQLHFIDDLYKQNKLPKLGLLVNDVSTKGSQNYYGYGGGSYGYGYGYGYGYAQQNGYYEDETRKKWWKRIFSKA